MITGPRMPRGVLLWGWRVAAAVVPRLAPAPAAVPPPTLRAAAAAAAPVPAVGAAAVAPRPATAGAPAAAACMPVSTGAAAPTGVHSKLRGDPPCQQTQLQVCTLSPGGNPTASLSSSLLPVQVYRRLQPLDAPASACFSITPVVTSIVSSVPSGGPAAPAHDAVTAALEPQPKAWRVANNSFVTR